ncbi:MAG: 50S ribosomal protein L10 [Desulfovibrionaceae bacterium]|nr:50S ribosomal protein L10 [Desulfovibrionaceae bacterium]
MNKSEKAVIIEMLKARAEAAAISLVTDFKGMQVEELTTLRKKIRDANGEFYVVKNTLARIAFKGTPHEGIADMFKENCAVALGFEDPVTVAKVVSDFAKTSKIFSVRHGHLDGRVLTVDDVTALSKLPSKPELLAKALGTMNAVPTQFVCLFANIIRGMLNCLKAIEEQKAA